MTAASDFVQVQLSAAGIAFAGAGATVRIVNGHFSYVFTPGKPVRVLSSEWRRALSLKTVNGKAILELAPAPAAAPKVIAVPATHTDAPETVSADTNAQEVK